MNERRWFFFQLRKHLFPANEKSPKMEVIVKIKSFPIFWGGKNDLVKKRNEFLASLENWLAAAKVDSKRQKSASKICFKVESLEAQIISERLLKVETVDDKVEHNFHRNGGSPWKHILLNGLFIEWMLILWIFQRVSLSWIDDSLNLMSLFQILHWLGWSRSNLRSLK